MQHGKTPLAKACFMGELKVITVLLRAGAMTEIQDKVATTDISHTRIS